MVNEGSENRRKREKKSKWVDNPIGESEILELSEALEGNTALTELDLNCDETEFSFFFYVRCDNQGKSINYVIRWKNWR